LQAARVLQAVQVLQAVPGAADRPGPPGIGVLRAVPVRGAAGLLRWDKRDSVPGIL
jgi:hypothetical protein